MKGLFIRRIALALILIGAVISVTRAVRGDIELSVGEKRSSFNGSKHIYPLGFMVSLEGFDLDRNPDGSLKAAESLLKITDGSRELHRKIRVNAPFTYKGYTFYQSGYDPEKADWTDIAVVKDPGVIPLFAGFVLLNIGAFWMLAGEVHKWQWQ